MIIDKLSQVDSDATVTGGTTVVSVSSYDQGTPDRALGTGKPLYLVVVVKAKSGGDGSDTFRFDAIAATAADLGTGVRVLASSKTITGIANVAVGATFTIAIPQGEMIAERYLGAGYAVTANAVLTVDAFFSDTPGPDHTTYVQGAPSA